LQQQPALSLTCSTQAERPARQDIFYKNATPARTKRKGSQRHGKESVANMHDNA